MLFADRRDAGRRLAGRLLSLRGSDVVVVGIPRGGVPVAAEVAAALGAPLDVLMVRKLGVPFQPELAMGAVGEGGVRVVDDKMVPRAGVTADELAEAERREEAELDRRASRYRPARPGVSLTGRTVVVVDDGIATGLTARAACRVARAQGAARVVLAVPVATASMVQRLSAEAEVDEVVCLDQPRNLRAVGERYEDFSQTSDDEVVELLAESRRSGPTSERTGCPDDDPPAPVVEVELTAGGVGLAGRLMVPDTPTGLVVCARGSADSRHSPRDRFAARVLNQAGLATLLVDLLTHGEEVDRSTVFDIELLAFRLGRATSWVRARPELSQLPVGYLGTSTAAAAALWAATDPGAEVAAVVSRGGRPDLAGPRLDQVRAPTLLIVGAQDRAVLELNRRAQTQLRGESRLAVVAGAGHLFEEPGTLGTATNLARDWLHAHLVPAARR